MKSVDLFLRTYPGDFKWLPFLLRSLVRHARGFRKLLVVLPQNEVVPFELLPFFSHCVEAGVCVDWRWAQARHRVPDDYAGQCLTKLQAHIHLAVGNDLGLDPAEEVIYLDSDLVLLRDLTPDTLRAPDGRLRLEARTWEEAGPAPTDAWYAPTAKLLHVAPPFETMCRHPFQYPVDLVRRCYEYVGGYKRLLEVGRFSEFNLLGNYAYLHAKEEFVFEGPAEWGPRAPVVQQFWSWGGLTLEVERELRRLGYWEDQP